jgi:hypothetical protein
MVVQRLDMEDSYLILDDQGRPVGRVVHTECHLDERPPGETVLLVRSPYGRNSGAPTRAAGRSRAAM